MIEYCFVALFEIFLHCHDIAYSLLAVNEFRCDSFSPH